VTSIGIAYGYDSFVTFGFFCDLVLIGANLLSQANAGAPGVSGDSHIMQGTQFWRACEDANIITAPMGMGLDTAFALTWFTWTGYKGELTRRKRKFNYRLGRCRTRAEHLWRRSVAQLPVCFLDIH
jgi:hypothetical protein